MEKLITLVSMYSGVHWDDFERIYFKFMHPKVSAVRNWRLGANTKHAFKVIQFAGNVLVIIWYTMQSCLTLNYLYSQNIKFRTT